MNEESQKLLSDLRGKLGKGQLPEDLHEQITIRLDQLELLTGSPSFLPELDRINRYIEWVVSLPWNTRTDDILDLKRAKEVFEKNHYGLAGLKDRILEYMSVMQLNQANKDAVARAPILCLVGLVGTGKTTMAISIAEAMGRRFARIPFGGMGDPLDLRGQSRMHPEAEPGKVIKALRQAQSKNPVILLDEIDRVTDEGRGSIMGVLVELLDPEQNKAFVDHYLDYPFDLSDVLFVATANNTHGIATAVMDRLEPINMPSYNDEEKMVIGKKYILPSALKAANVPVEAVVIEDAVWSKLVRPLGFDAGIRTLQRTIFNLVRKVARQIVEGKATKFVINEQNVKEYIASEYV